MYKGPKTKLAKFTRRRSSEYGLQLREKQRLRQIYGIREKMLKNYFKRALRAGENVDLHLGRLLEKRLDNVVYRLGLATSRPQARQLVNHGHILVNGRRVTIPSFLVKIGDKIGIRPQSESKKVFQYLNETLKRHQTPSWLKLDKTKKQGEVIGEPSLEELPEKINLSFIIEFYSR